jgi:RND family efflux transporter MFP subunit
VRGHAFRVGLAILAAAAAGAWAGFHFGTSASSSGSPAAAARGADEGPGNAAASADGAVSPGEAPVLAHVEVARIERGTLREQVETYGTVVAALGETTSVSVPYECRVRKVLVAGGQVVAKGAPLVEVEPSPDAALDLEQATGERDAAKSALDLVQQRLEMKLATRADVLGAQHTLQTAERKLGSLQRRGIDGAVTLRSPGDAIVNDLRAEPGAIVGAGAPLLTEVAEDRILVRLGIEAEDAPGLQVDQEVRLDPVNAPGGQTVRGRIRLITRRVDPATRLVDVFVAPAAGARLLLNAYVRGTLTVQVAEGLLVPRAAVRPVDGKEVLFTVKAGKAVRHEVATGIASSDQVQIHSDELREGDEVVVTGNAELEDGMRVETGRSR